MLEMLSSKDWWCYHYQFFCSNPKIIYLGVRAEDWTTLNLCWWTGEVSIWDSWSIPKFDGIFLTYSEKLPKFTKDGCHVDLIWMGFIIEYLFCCMDGVSDNNDFGNVFLAICLVDTAFNSKELYFCASDKNNDCHMWWRGWMQSYFV